MKNKTTLDKIADIIRTLKVDGEKAYDILELMSTLEEKYSMSYASLRRVPGFCKLYDALAEMCDNSVHLD